MFLVIVVLTLSPTLIPVHQHHSPSVEWMPEECEDPIYVGITYCTEGDMHILKVDPKDPVQFEVVLPRGNDRNGPVDECRDVNVPDFVIPGKSTGPGCYDPNNNKYPAEVVGEMVIRYKDRYRNQDKYVVVAFNADLFSHPEYYWGPQGLTVKNGDRFDGPLYNDLDEQEVKRPSLTITRNGDVRIGYADPSSLPDQTQPPSEAYWNTVGGTSLLLKDGRVAEDIDEGPDPINRRGRTAVGRMGDGTLIIIVISDEGCTPQTPECKGVILQDLARIMEEFGAVDAINLDGGGSSQLWYIGHYLIYSGRPVPEGLLVFSEEITSGSSALGSVGGLVVAASNGEAIQGATVELVGEGLTRTTMTDSSGLYLFSGIPVGSVEISASKLDVGKGSASVTVVANQNTTANISLKRSIWEEILEIIQQLINALKEWWQIIASCWEGQGMEHCIVELWNKIPDSVRTFLSILFAILTFPIWFPLLRAILREIER
jgi:hypothetical protein